MVVNTNPGVQLRSHYGEMFFINGVIFHGNIISKWRFDWDVHESRGSQDIALTRPGRAMKAVESQAGRELWGET